MLGEADGVDGAVYAWRLTIAMLTGDWIPCMSDAVSLPLGPIMMDLEGAALTAQEREVLRHPLIGGLILFARNYVDPQQLAELVRQVRALRDPPLIVAVDQEGGRVQRLRKGFTRLPAVATLGVLYDRDPDHALDMCEVSGWLMASELRAVDVDISFAPVLDLANADSEVMAGRAFHASPESASMLAGAYARGMRMGGMPSTAKHFPGHGGVAEDSHRMTPVDQRDYQTLAQCDLKPFEDAIRQGVEAVMAAHVLFPAVDARPASMSPVWLQAILRDRLRFSGAVFSDDVSMGGAMAYGAYPERARLMLAAGCDMLPVCNHPEGVAQIIDALGGVNHAEAQPRLLAMRGRGAVTMAALLGSRQWRAAVLAVQRYAAEVGDAAGVDVGGVR